MMVRLLPHLNQIFCEDVVDVLQPGDHGRELGQVPDHHGIVKPRRVPPLLPGLASVGQLDLKEERLLQLGLGLHPIGTEEHGNVDHVVVVARDIVVVHPVDQILPGHPQAGLVNVDHPPAGVLAVCHNGEVNEEVSAVAVLSELVCCVNPAEIILIPIISLGIETIFSRIV